MRPNRPSSSPLRLRVGPVCSRPTQVKAMEDQRENKDPKTKSTSQSTPRHTRSNQSNRGTALWAVWVCHAAVPDHIIKQQINNHRMFKPNLYGGLHVFRSPTWPGAIFGTLRWMRMILMRSLSKGCARPDERTDGTAGGPRETSRETNRRAAARTGERRRNPQQTARVATHLGRYANTFTNDTPGHPLGVYMIQT